MYWYQLLVYFSGALCLSICMIHGFRVIKNGNPKDYSQKVGNTGSAIRYSYTGAMSPVKKESAYMHLPTYAAGLLYHIATFLSLFLLIIFLIGLEINNILTTVFLIILAAGALSGLGIFIKRIVKSHLRYLSNPDDYISNILVTLFQFGTLLMLTFPQIEMAYYLLVSILLLYIPIGKLKHTVYFFAARYHLGFFYGWRGVWPPNS